jgi:hypothetical protein
MAIPIHMISGWMPILKISSIVDGARKMAKNYDHPSIMIWLRRSRHRLLFHLTSNKEVLRLPRMDVLLVGLSTWNLLAAHQLRAIYLFQHRTR